MVLANQSAQPSGRPNLGQVNQSCTYRLVPCLGCFVFLAWSVFSSVPRFWLYEGFKILKSAQSCRFLVYAAVKGLKLLK
jgi:hypothetical protein